MGCTPVPQLVVSLALARKLKLPRTRIERLAKEGVGLTVDTALRLAKFFGTSAEFWMRFQTAYEIETGARDLEAALAAIEPMEMREAA